MRRLLLTSVWTLCATCISCIPGINTLEAYGVHEALAMRGRFAVMDGGAFYCSSVPALHMSLALQLASLSLVVGPLPTQVCH
jgi:hypothetical protein